MKVAYERVSTTGQSTLRQEVMMKEHQIEKVFSEKISGKDRNRPELQKMLDFVREGDVVVIESISRLARSTRDFLNILDELEKKQAEAIKKLNAFKFEDYIEEINRAADEVFALNEFQHVKREDVEDIMNDKSLKEMHEKDPTKLDRKSVV